MVSVTQIVGIIMVVLGGFVAVFLNQPGLGGVIIALGLWVGSMVFKK